MGLWISLITIPVASIAVLTQIYPGLPLFVSVPVRVITVVAPLVAFGAKLWQRAGQANAEFAQSIAEFTRESVNVSGASARS